MMNYLLFGSSPWLFPAIAAVVLAVALELPTAIERYLEGARQIPDSVWNAVQAGLLTLVAFMLGISFSQSVARYDARRALVTTEANAIGTTWLRADQLPARDVKRFRAILTDYTATRLRAYQGSTTPESRDEALARSDREQGQLWSVASNALRESPQNLGRSLLVQTLNEAIDVSAEQVTVLTHHVPTSILTLTLILAVLGTLLIGLSFSRSRVQPRTLGAVYVAAILLVASTMVDLDRPQKGFIRVSLDPLTVQLQAMRRF